MNQAKLFKPELLAPAGSLEKLKTAILFGADAVYIGGSVFGLRKYTDNFDLGEIQEGIAFAHDKGKLVYMVLNGFAHDKDLSTLKKYLLEIKDFGIDAFIISDMGVLQLAKSLTTVPIHVSTQASVTNLYTCKLFQEAGAKRIILAREVSIQECIEIKKELDIELEVFVHGAMCASYSGKCVISNYTVGRDSNRGGCIQSCRHEYKLTDGDTDSEETAYIMNAKDLNAIQLIPQLMEAGIDSLKIEGRMKSVLYLGNAVSAYRKAIDQHIEESDALKKVSNRGFSTGGLEHRPGGESISQFFGAYEKSVEFIGSVRAVQEGVGIYVSVNSPFSKADKLEFLRQSGDALSISAASMKSVTGTPLEKVHPNSLVRLEWVPEVQPFDILRKKI